MKIFIVNAGSSSLKYQLIDMDDKSVIVKGLCERIGIDGHIKLQKPDGSKFEADFPMPAHTTAFKKVIEWMTTGETKVIDDLGDITAAGHRIVQGGAYFKESCLIDDEALEKIADYGKKEYSFGALSDLHFNRYNGSLAGDDATITFPNALSFIEGFDVELVGMSGDISADGERDAFEKFNSIASNYDFPVYTCTGNHDVSEYYELMNWQELVNEGVYGKTKADGVEAVADNGLDFVYAPESANGDAFIFLSQYQWDYGNAQTSRILKDEQLNWLEAQLETYKDKSVFLFFHTFLANAEGEPMMGEGNLLTEKGHHYDLVFTPGAADEIRFRGMMKKYENVVFFNGHSHWAYSMQEINPQLNITNHNGTYATMVHLSSVSSPRTTSMNSDDTTENYMRKSEGMIVTVYDDCIVFTACDFLKGQLLAYATYVVEK